MSTATTRPLAEYVAMQYLLLGDLREALEQPLSADNQRWLLMILDELLETLACEFRLEEEDGYLAEVLDERPNWSPQVDDLLAQHETLFTNLLTLRRHLMEQRPLLGYADAIRAESREWMATLAAHQRHERRLLQNAFVFDTGVGD